ncbi:MULTISPECIES: winged helix-turn-helix domain-containing protein [unclassified Hyphomonas]|uniref:winged helix-turn-helix domain-containing protein n=1 Tax=unclassified Hyphomonas TaxID=2630699 RepID=UPI0025BDE845|nr:MULTISPECIES: crosslink repair DNA glycosylase YcaQ family protein [unclassified Hyphomonas]|tara:strand:+ start:1419 stop:2585 length:1167 start_codon:yes stop_codon:yes gene_type:complete
MSNMTPLRISNREARRLWLWTNGLAETPTGKLDVMGMLHALGFVQIDTIRNVTRAHHHILWSRNQNYREEMLWPLLGRDRQIFEHFTHDASLIPMAYLPYWQRQFRRLGAKVARHEWFQSGLAQEQIAQIRARIEAEGALSTHAFDTKATSREMWARPPHKRALDQMWYAGDLATCYRQNFVKYYNLPDRVFPAPLRDGPPDHEQIDWLCQNAIDRLSFGTTGEIQRFWQAMSSAEAKSWVMSAKHLVPVEIECSNRRTVLAYATPDIETRLATAPAPTSRLRILNPFDPAVRDRNRLERLFGFDYRNEMFVPAAKRRWGYYVYPLLEGDRFTGRIEIKADRAKGWMSVTGFWPEPNVKWTPARHDKLNAELTRFARLAGIGDVRWAI